MDMKLELLVPTMQQKDVSLAEKMNIQTDAVIVNQTDINEYQEYLHNGSKIRMYSFAERGVGLSRNTSLMRSVADICILADDDMRFRDGYADTVRKAFSDNPKADVIIFNLVETGVASRVNQTVRRISWFNYMNYGAARIAFRRLAVSYKGISFNLNFGGGTKHQCGEDTLFLRDCLAAGLNVIAVPTSIAELLDDRPSTWFQGYDRKYLFDKGVVLSLAHPRLAKLFCLYLTLRHREYMCDGLKRMGVFAEMCRGIQYVKRKEYYKQG